MSFKVLSRLPVGNLRLKPPPTAFSGSTSGCSLAVKHDRPNRRFTVSPGSEADCAVLLYRFTGEKEVDLMSTYVPETFRGHGVAALLSRAAMDFLIEENLKAHISCWYIKKYIKKNPLQRYEQRVIH
ncbi:protein NATD1-like [Spinachia spinachia]